MTVTDSDDDDFLRGRLVSALTGEYEVGEVLGRGGMAVVYRGRMMATGRAVAIKVIRGDQLRDPESRARFEREAALTLVLDHQHIVQTFEVRELAPRGLALILELMDGGTLKDLIKRRGRLPANLARSLLRDIARRLAHAHAQGVVHRDLKPENIFLRGGGDMAKVGDFGIARSTTADTLTLTGTVIGTPAYMSPEQVDGQRVDARSDMYSFGLIAWEMLTGMQPWQGESLFSIIHKQKTATLPAVSSIRQDVPVWLERAVVRCMQKDPANRLAAAELLALLPGAQGSPSVRGDDPAVVRGSSVRGSRSPASGHRTFGQGMGVAPRPRFDPDRAKDRMQETTLNLLDVFGAIAVGVTVIGCMIGWF